MPTPCSPWGASRATLRSRASRLLEPALHGVHAGVQRLVAGGVGRIEDAGTAPRGVIGDPVTLHRRQAACEPGAGQLAPGELGGPLAEGPDNLSQRIADPVEVRERRRLRRRRL